MRIVDETTFLAMPAGTLYAKYQPCITDEVCIKDDSVESLSEPGKMLTWWYQDLLPQFDGNTNSDEFFDSWHAIERGEPSPPLDFDCTTKDGLYEHDQLFAVFEKQDVEALVARLQRALTDGYGG